MLSKSGEVEGTNNINLNYKCFENTLNILKYFI